MEVRGAQKGRAGQRSGGVSGCARVADAAALLESGEGWQWEGVQRREMDGERRDGDGVE
jgi:hypothetical protein